MKLLDMTHIADNTKDFETLEALIDRHGLAAVTETLAVIASAKADHIRENWQDERTAGVWDKAVERILKAHSLLDRRI